MNSHVSEALDASKIKEELRATLAKNIISARKAKAKLQEAKRKRARCEKTMGAMMP